MDGGRAFSTQEIWSCVFQCRVFSPPAGEPRTLATPPLAGTAAAGLRTCGTTDSDDGRLAVRSPDPGSRRRRRRRRLRVYIDRPARLARRRRARQRCGLINSRHAPLIARRATTLRGRRTITRRATLASDSFSRSSALYKFVFT